MFTCKTRMLFKSAALALVGFSITACGGATIDVSVRNSSSSQTLTSVSSSVSSVPSSHESSLSSQVSSVVASSSISSMTSSGQASSVFSSLASSVISSSSEGVIIISSQSSSLLSSSVASSVLSSLASSSSVSSMVSSLALSSSSAQSSSLAASSSSAAAQLIVAINAGATNNASYQGVTYTPDRFYDGGTSNSTNDTIRGDENGTLFKSERYGDYSYNIPVTAGDYSLKFHFVELYQTAVGSRAFNLSVEGREIFSNLDLYALVGHDAAYSVDVDNVSVTDGFITINLNRIVDNATLSGLAIYSSNGELDEQAIIDPPPPVTGVATAENTGADCPVPSLADANALPQVAQLPDPFRTLDGSRITRKDQWRCLRNDTSLQLQKYESGDKPPKPAQVSGSVTNSAVNVQVTHNSQTISFQASVTLPSSGQAPYPVVIGVGGSNLDNNYLASQGVAVINFNNNNMGAQNGGNSRGTGLFYNLYGNNHSASSMVAWAWGVSRIIDVLEGSNNSLLDARRVGVTGCSRNGKGALMAGALDERIALTIPQESGAGGAVAWRVAQSLSNSGVETQTLSNAANEQPWFRANFGANFGNNVTRLPIDHHQVMGMVAPRGLLILDNDISWLGPRAGYVGTAAAKEIYRALGAADNIAYSENGGHSHCSFPSHQQSVLDAYVKKFLLNQTSNTHVMRTTKSSQSEVNNWVNWSTPTLQ